MKVCFYQHALFTYIGHAMAVHVKSLLPDTTFCAFAQKRAGWKFLTIQEDIDYGTIPLAENIFDQSLKTAPDIDYIRDFEKTYGIPNAWPYIYIDRIIMHGQYVREYPYDYPLLTRERMLAYLEETVKTVLDFLEREKPDILVFAVIGSLPSMVLYHVAKKKGIKTLVIKGTRIGRGMTFTDDYLALDAVQKRFQERIEKNIPPLETAVTHLKEFREHPVPYFKEASPHFNKQTHRSANIRFLHPKRLIKSIAWHATEFWNDVTQKRDYNEIRIWWKVWDKLRRKVRGLIGYEKFYCIPNDTERFAYYPLHLEPETALLLDSPYHTNQIELIRAAAHALPIDMFLYVKEHPQMVGYRTRAYYREITKIPNVKLIDPRISGTDLIQKAGLVFSVTGTGGFESVMFGKPVITFTKVYYNDLSSVIMCRDFDELPFVVKKQLEEHIPSETEIEQYISALLEESVDVDYGELWTGGLPASEIAKNEPLRELSMLLLKRLEESAPVGSTS